MNNFKEITQLKSQLSTKQFDGLNKNIQLFNDRVFICFMFNLIYFFIRVVEMLMYPFIRVINIIFCISVPLLTITYPFLFIFSIYYSIKKDYCTHDSLLWLEGFALPLIFFISYLLITSNMHIQFCDNIMRDWCWSGFYLRSSDHGFLLKKYLILKKIITLKKNNTITKQPFTKKWSENVRPCIFDTEDELLLKL